MTLIENKYSRDGKTKHKREQERESCIYPAPKKETELILLFPHCNTRDREQEKEREDSDRELRAYKAMFNKKRETRNAGENRRERKRFLSCDSRPLEDQHNEHAYHNISLCLSVCVYLS